MGNRMISFGYGYANGKIIIVEKEAKIVQHIFQEYLAGKTLQAIASRLQEEKTEYDKGVCQWNKNRIYRILANKKYTGASTYPAVLSQDIFEHVQQIKNEKGFRKQPSSDRVAFLKPIVFCGECGQTMYRRAKQRIKEKWLCPSGCKCATYIDDERLISAMTAAVQRVQAHPHLARQIPNEPTYQRTPSILQYTNAITRALHSEQPSFYLGKKLIYECANLKFQACKENTNLSYTETMLSILKNDQTSLNEEAIRKFVSKLVVDPDGKITVYLLNGVPIQEELRC